ncbi:hypothetical protein [Hymenobacter daeguensis]
MNLLRTLNGAVLLGLAGAGLNSCIQAPDYSFTPEIDFKEAKNVFTPSVNGNSPRNEITFVLNFRDGDGDLGLSQDDIKQPPYNQPPQAPVPLGRNHATNEYNYFIQPELFNNGVWTAFQAGIVGEYDGTFPRLDGTDAKPAPLKGELNYRLPLDLDGAIYKPNQKFRFKLTIVDRAFHVSNTVTSTEITLGQ